MVPDGTPPAGFYTEKTTVPLLKNKDGGGIEVDGTKTRPVTVALVGLHVVGVTANHPEFLWATFEQINNAPDLPVGMDPTSPNAVSTQAFTFYAANTPANKCNIKADGKHGRPQLQVTDPVKQTVAPVTNIFRQYATGGADCARTADINSINSSAQNEMAGLAKAQPKEAVWANYKLIGTLWLQACTLQPGVSELETQGIASVNLANSTLETFYQGSEHNFNHNSMANCFMCHNTGATAPTAKIPYPGKNINLSHALLDTIPAPTPTPSPIATPTATPAVKKPQ